MATRTTNYRMTKPEGTDLVDIDVLNGNFDIIDTQLKANADRTAGKQDALTFDNTPTENSANPVKSGGVFSALAGKVSVEDIGNLWTWDKYGYVPASYSLGARYTTGDQFLWYGNSNTFSSIYPIMYQISDSISVAPDGTISLVNPTNCMVYKTGYTTYAGAGSIKGKFFKYVRSLSSDVVSCSFADGVIYYLPSDGRVDASSGPKFLYVHYHQLVTGINEKEMSVASGLIEVVASKNETAYPDDGRSGND